MTYDEEEDHLGNIKITLKINRGEIFDSCSLCNRFEKISIEKALKSEKISEKLLALHNLCSKIETN